MRESSPGKELQRGKGIPRRKSSIDKGLERDPDLFPELPVSSSAWLQG